MPNLVVDHIRKEFPTRAEPLVVLRDASLKLAAGENVAILGPSGSGKSTLLHIIGTLDYPTEGRVELGGQAPFALPEAALADFRNQKIGFIFQDHHLLPQLSVLENVLLPTMAHGPSNKESLARARDLIERVGLNERIEHRPAELSGGERQRVAVARALVNQPVLLLADEPTGNLDRTNALGIGKLLLDLSAREKTMLAVVTHSLELAELFDERRHLEDGCLR
jgi:lipoprotein-releasing system ATP-binding protein